MKYETLKALRLPLISEAYLGEGDPGHPLLRLHLWLMQTFHLFHTKRCLVLGPRAPLFFKIYPRSAFEFVCLFVLCSMNICLYMYIDNETTSPYYNCI